MQDIPRYDEVEDEMFISETRHQSDANGAGNEANDIVMSGALIPRSSSSTPTDQKTRPSSTPETDIFEFLESSKSSQTDSPHGSPPTSVCTGATAGENDDLEDDAMHEDEVVLLPTPLSRRM